MADMNAIRTTIPVRPEHLRPALLALAAVAAGLGVGAVAWLWSTHGLSVYLVQMANFAMTCF
jgi:hypothetical protein